MRKPQFVDIYYSQFNMNQIINNENSDGFVHHKNRIVLSNVKSIPLINEIKVERNIEPEIEDSFDEELEEESFLDPRCSFLNPFQSYVKVDPLMLGKPLASNNTPLDLSSVPKMSNYAPFYNDEFLSKDELKLYSLLEYELNLENSSLNTLHYFEFNKENKQDSFFPIFKYNRSWFNILNKIDHPTTPTESKEDIIPYNYTPNEIDQETKHSVDFISK